MLPNLSEQGFLPKGKHNATLEEFEKHFVYFDMSDRRFRLYEGLKRLCEEARRSGIVRRILIGGSFVTSKPEPNDFDCIVVLDPSINRQELRPREYNIASRRTACRLFGGDVFPVVDGSPEYDEIVNLFQSTRGGERIGIVEIDL
jgi:hypothetical protein